MTMRLLPCFGVLLLLAACGPGAVGSEDEAADAAVSTSSDGTGGLQGDYFSGTDFQTKVLSRTDGTVNFFWGSGSPASGVPADGFSVRWTGYVTPRFSQTYTLSTYADDGTRLWVNGKLLIDDWNHHAVTWKGATIALQANVAYAIKLEYFERTGEAVAQLNWKSASEPYAVIPASRLSPTPGTPVVTTPTSTTFVLGVQSGADGYDVSAYQSWLGTRPVTMLATYNGNGDWSSVENPQWVLASYAFKPWVAADPKNHIVQLGVEPFPTSGTLAACAHGDYDQHYKNMGTNFVNAGMGRSAFRFAWEEAGNWFPWGTGRLDAKGNLYEDASLMASYKVCFQHFYVAVHSTDPAAIVTWDADSADYNAKVYPGDAYVDQVSRDVYDESYVWDNELGGSVYPFPSGCDAACQNDRRERAWTEGIAPDLIADANFATAHHKPFSLGEWGVTWKLDGHGGLDNPNFIQHIYNVMTGTEKGMTPGFQAGFSTYWDNLGDKNSAGAYTIDTRLRGGKFPNAAAKYRQLFGK